MKNSKGSNILNNIWALTMLKAMFDGLRFLSGHRYHPAQYERARGVYLHPTKGWRGEGTFPRGTNKRRIRRAASL